MVWSGGGRSAGAATDRRSIDKSPAAHAARERRLGSRSLRQAEGYIGFVEELPGANTQGSTLEETQSNLKGAVALMQADS
jgi:hypothetical protein